ncbi:MAG: 3-phosphoserine/phosphohydroxythreonine transaminase [Flavobacteriaceae bacterium]|nr:3-phosphoserine/phosphohydroxythreonine transaminase [Flavobacteriaceae bacterium]
MKKHNFSAGPSILPALVMEKAAAAVQELDGIGLSLIEISHRSKEFVAIMDKAQDLALELTGLKGKGYQALFLQGGASMQFLMAAANLMQNKAGYINTGAWSDKAIKEAKRYGEVIEIASSKEANFNYIPKGQDIPTDLDYLHITTNNTIFGTQFHDLPQTNVPLIADMSSDIFSREFDYSAFDLFYAGAQKNMGPAGTTLVIVKDSLLEKMNKDVPSMLSYATHADKGSMFNTPPVFAVYTSMLTLEWLKEKGGISAIQEHNITKAKLIYDEIDRNTAFEGFAAKEDRSYMNATFNLAEGVDGSAFDEMWNAANISGLKGHRSVGGYRASIYNALPLESAQQLVDVMQQFEKTL